MTYNSSQNIVELFNLKLSGTSEPALLRKITVDIRKKQKFYIVTPNPEILMTSLSDSDLKKALNNAEISIPDGIGLIAGYRFLSMPSAKNTFARFGTLLMQGAKVGYSVLFDRYWLEKDLKAIKGRELFLELIKVANKNGWKVFLLGGEGNEAEGTKKILERNYKSIKIQTERGPILSVEAKPLTDKDREIEGDAIEKINNFQPDMFFVAFDGVKAAKWMYRHIQELNVGCAMMVGGTFKYMTGKQKFPPKWVNDLGLEWLWRLFTGSQKLSRITSAVIKFPLKVFAYKLLSN